MDNETVPALTVLIVGYIAVFGYQVNRINRLKWRLREAERNLAEVQREFDQELEFFKKHGDV